MGCANGLWGVGVGLHLEGALTVDDTTQSIVLGRIPPRRARLCLVCACARVVPACGRFLCVCVRVCVPRCLLPAGPGAYLVFMKSYARTYGRHRCVATSSVIYTVFFCIRTCNGSLCVCSLSTLSTTAGFVCAIVFLTIGGTEREYQIDSPLPPPPYPPCFLLQVSR